MRHLATSGLDKLNSHTYVKLTAIALWENLPLVLLAGLVFTLLSAPAVILFFMGLHLPALATAVLTIPPGWTALLTQEAEALSSQHTSILTTLRALPRVWGRSVALGVLAAVPAASWWWTVEILSRPDAPTMLWLGLIANVVGLIILLPLYLYAFPLLALYDVRVHAALSNALILASRHIANTLGLLGMGILFAFGVGYISSGLLFILPAVWGVFLVNNCRMVVDEELASTGQRRI